MKQIPNIGKSVILFNITNIGKVFYSIYVNSNNDPNSRLEIKIF